MRFALVIVALTACRSVSSPSVATSEPPRPVPPISGELEESLRAALANEPPPLVVAAERGDLREVERLVSEGAGVDVAPEEMDYDFAWTALTVARARNHRAVVELLERANAEEQCHIFARSHVEVELYGDIDGHVIARLPADTRLVVTGTKGSWLRVLEYAAGSRRIGWTRSPLEPELEGRQLAAHPNGPYASEALGSVRMVRCHCYTALVIDERKREGWVHAVRGPGWGG